MIEINIPTFGFLRLAYLVTDYNGTLAKDGILLPGVSDRLIKLASLLELHVLTADTFGLAEAQLRDLPIKLTVLSKNNEALQKQQYLEAIGAENVVAFGNGNNDQMMLRAARLSITVIGPEGASFGAIQAANIIVTNIGDGLDLLINPLRCVATLRH